MSLHIVLYQPVIPQNTGNIIRLAANTGCKLHLITPLGFNLEEKALRRAGLDYHDMASVQVHDQLPDLPTPGQRAWYTISSQGQQRYDQVRYPSGSVLVFGSETQGFDAAYRSQHPPNEHWLRLPMQTGSRSLNLANSVAVVAYEALRQQGFSGLA